MKTLLTLLTATILTTQASAINHQNCSCTKCECTLEKHCGCLSDEEVKADETPEQKQLAHHDGSHPNDEEGEKIDLPEQNAVAHHGGSHGDEEGGCGCGDS